MKAVTHITLRKLLRKSLNSPDRIASPYVTLPTMCASMLQWVRVCQHASVLSKLNISFNKFFNSCLVYNFDKTFFRVVVDYLVYNYQISKDRCVQEGLQIKGMSLTHNNACQATGQCTPRTSFRCFSRESFAHQISDTQALNDLFPRQD